MRSERMSIKDFNELRQKKSKYNNQRIEYQGWKFDSKLECDYFKYLQVLLSAGRIRPFHRQVPFHLAPGSKLVVDFMVRYIDDPEVYYVDTKGVMTAEALTKIKMAEHLYKIKIQIVKRGDF